MIVFMTRSMFREMSGLHSAPAPTSNNLPARTQPRQARQHATPQRRDAAGGFTRRQRGTQSGADIAPAASRSQLRPVCQVGCKVSAKFTRIVAGTVNETRLPAPQERHSQQVEAGCLHDACIMADPPLVVEYRHVEPRVVRPE